jgi:hypothetical protein
MHSAALSNVRLEHADVRAFDEQFHVGLALHACGEVPHSHRAESDAAHEAGVVLTAAAPNKRILSSGNAGDGLGAPAVRSGAGGVRAGVVLRGQGGAQRDSDVPEVGRVSDATGWLPRPLSRARCRRRCLLQRHAQ